MRYLNRHMTLERRCIDVVTTSKSEKESHVSTGVVFE